MSTHASSIDRRALLASLAGLSLAPSPARARASLPVAASFTILADFLREVGGDRLTVDPLVGPDADAHSFNPSPADARKLARARLIVVNGLGFEGWLDRLIAAAGSRAPVLVATKGIVARRGGGAIDPHAWQSVANAKVYVANIRDGLIAADGPGETAFTANAARYLAVLEALEGEVRAAIAAIPAARRRIITTHDAFGYFADAYGVEFLAPEGVSADSEASAADVARIIRQAKAEGIPAVFLENVSNPRLMRQIAAESGARIGGKLHSDALGARGGPAATYVAMMRHNVAALSTALRASA